VCGAVLVTSSGMKVVFVYGKASTVAMWIYHLRNYFPFLIYDLSFLYKYLSLSPAFSHFEAILSLIPNASRTLRIAQINAISPFGVCAAKLGMMSLGKL
jgi:hypothetical protein